MNFCTSAAWKCPGSSVIRRTDGASSSLDGLPADAAGHVSRQIASGRHHAAAMRFECRHAFASRIAPYGARSGRDSIALASASFTNRSVFASHVERPAELHRDPAHDARGVAAMRDRRRRERRLARLHALEPVLVMRGLLRQLHRHAVRIEQFRIAGVERLQAIGARGCGSLEVAAVRFARNKNPAFVADELDAVRKLVRHGHENVARIRQLDVVSAVHVPDLVRREFALAFDPARAREFEFIPNARCRNDARPSR